MLASTASAPRVTRCSLGLYWSLDRCSKHAGWLTGWLEDVILSRSDSERQRNLMMHAKCPLPVYYSQVCVWGGGGVYCRVFSGERDNFILRLCWIHWGTIAPEVVHLAIGQIAHVHTGACIVERH